MKRRRIYFIKKRFQAMFILGFSILIVLESLTIGALLYYLLYNRLNEAIYRSHIKIKTTGELIAPILINVNTAVAITVILIAIIFLLIIARRVEYSLGIFMESATRIGSGDLTCRIDDQYHLLTADLAHSFNKMTEGIKEKVDALKVNLEGIEDGIKSLDQRLRTGIPAKDSLQENIQTLSRATERFEEDLRRFKV